MDVLNDGETWRVDSADCLIRQYANKIKGSDNATVKRLAKTLSDQSNHRTYKYWYNKIHKRGMVKEVESIFSDENVS